MESLVAPDVFYDDQHHLAADLYQAKGKAKAGIILIHGGGWFRGDKSKDADWAKRLADAGYFVAAPNYRNTPAGYYPDPLTDMDTLYHWLSSQELPYPKDHLAVVGSSAGGNMAVEMSLKYGMPAVSLSGILDIGPWLETHQQVVAEEGDTIGFNSQASATINQSGTNDSFYKWFVTNYLQDEARGKAATPFLHTTRKAGPMYLANSLQEFVPTSGVINMAAALADNQVPSAVRLLTGSRHAKGYLADVDADVMAFLARVI